jgi:hypothetical protein
VSILNKALEKKKDDRYQRASLMSTHLKELAKRIDVALAQKNAGKNGNQ